MAPPKLEIYVWFIATLFTTLGHGGTLVGFYQTSCPTAEAIVQSTVESAFGADSTLAPGLLQMFFHDCFSNGCDASILINGPSSEKTAAANSQVRGFEVVDAAKTLLETACPGVVSCADILALAARDAVVQAGGLSWAVPTGRRDGLVSRASDVANLPGFTEPANVLIRKFMDKGLDAHDLVVLSGAHSIGTAACSTFNYRLYNFNNTAGPDPRIHPELLSVLRVLCPVGGDASRRVNLDIDSVHFDNSYYINVRTGRGVLESDAVLWSNPTTRQVVQQYVGFFDPLFGVDFGKAMVKMGSIELKTGTQGEIRRVCTAVN